MIQRRRRKLKIEGDRQHKCGCGKTYLSYPALYTHVKLKHQSIFPDGSVSKNKIISSKKEDKINSNIEPEYKDQIKILIRDIDPYNEVIHRDLTEEKVNDFFEVLISNNLEYAEIYKKNVLEALKNFENENYFDDYKNEFNYYQIFSYFLVDIYKFCSFSIFKDLMILIYFFITFLNAKGWDNCDNKIEEVFCEKGNKKIFYKLINLFLLDYYPLLIKKIQDLGVSLHLLGSDDEKEIKNLFLLIKLLSFWINENEIMEEFLDINIVIK